LLQQKRSSLQPISAMFTHASRGHRERAAGADHPESNARNRTWTGHSRPPARSDHAANRHGLCGAYSLSSNGFTPRDARSKRIPEMVDSAAHWCSKPWLAAMQLSVVVGGGLAGVRGRAKWSYALSEALLPLGIPTPPNVEIFIETVVFHGYRTAMPAARNRFRLDRTAM